MGLYPSDTIDSEGNRVENKLYTLNRDRESTGSVCRSTWFYRYHFSRQLTRGAWPNPIQSLVNYNFNYYFSKSLDLSTWMRAQRPRDAPSVLPTTIDAIDENMNNS